MIKHYDTFQTDPQKLHEVLNDILSKSKDVKVIQSSLAMGTNVVGQQMPILLVTVEIEFVDQIQKKSYTEKKETPVLSLNGK